MTIDLNNEELYILYDSFMTLKEDGNFILQKLQDIEFELEKKLKASWVDRGFYNEEELIEKYGYIFNEDNRRYH